MRNAILSLGAGALFVALAVHAADKHKGRIVAASGASKNNLTTDGGMAHTGLPFSLNQGAKYAVQCDARACVAAGTASSLDVICPGTEDAGTVGPRIEPDYLYDVPMAATDSVVGVRGHAGAVNCDVYAVTP